MRCEVDDQIGALRRRQHYVQYLNRRGQQSLVGADLVDLDALGQ